MEIYTVFMDWKTQHIIKISILLQLTYRSNAITSKIPVKILVGIDKTILKSIYTKAKEIEQLKQYWKTIKVGGITLPNFNTFYSYSNWDSRRHRHVISATKLRTQKWIHTNMSNWFFFPTLARALLTILYEYLSLKLLLHPPILHNFWLIKWEII